MSPYSRVCAGEGVVLIRTPNKGKAVVATRDFAAGQVVSSCPVIVLPSVEEFPDTVLSNYYMYWDEACSAIACGYAQFLNHSCEPNVDVDRNYAAETMEVHALRDIRAGEELTYRYHCQPWFAPEPPLRLPAAALVAR